MLRADGGVTLRVTDDGLGFTSARTRRRSARTSLGLVNMRERAEFISGTLTIKSIPREGTVIEVWVPLARKPARKKTS